MTRYLQLNDISSYKRAFSLSNYVWAIVSKWDRHAKNGLGIQYTDAIDSVSALIAEGFGRYSKKDKVHYYRMARGSVMESLDWTLKSKVRGLVTKSQYDHIIAALQELPREINQLIKYTRDKLKE